MDRTTQIAKILRKNGTPILPLRWARVLDQIVSAQTDPAKKAKQEHWRDLEYMIEGDGRLRSDWHSSGKHSRLYSSSPNIQGMHGKLRECVGWRGMAVVSVDIASAHVAIVANIAGDQPLSDALKAARQGQDFYQHLADQAGCTRPELKIALLAYLNGGSDPATVLPAVKNLFSDDGPYHLTGSWIRSVQEQARSKGKFSALGREYDLDADEQKRCHTAPSKAFQQIEFALLAGAAAALDEGKSCPQAQLIVFLHDELVYLVPAPDAPTLQMTVASIYKGLTQGLYAQAKNMNIDHVPDLKASVGATWLGCKTGDVVRGQDDAAKQARRDLYEQVVTDAAANFSTTRLDAIDFAKRRIADWANEPILPTDDSVDQVAARYCATIFAMDQATNFDLAAGGVDKGPNAAKTKATLKTLKASAKALNKKKNSIADDPEPEYDAGSDQIRIGRLEIGDDAELAERLVEGFNTKFESVVCDPVEGFHGLGTRSKVWETISQEQISVTIQAWSQTPVGESGRLRVGAGTVKSVSELAAARTTPPGKGGFFGTPPNGIVFKDGTILDVNAALAGEPPRRANDGDRIRPNDMLDFDIDPDADAPRFNQFLVEIWGDDPDFEDKKRFLLEWVGAALFGKATKYQKAIALTGHRGSGKGVLMEVIRSMFPVDHRTTADLKNLSGQESARHIAQIYRKKYVENPDMSKKFVDDTSVFKAAVAGEPVTGKVLYKDLFEFRPTAGWMFALDGDLQLPSAEDGIYRRLITLRHNTKFVSDPEVQNAKQHPDMVGIKFKAEDPHLSALLKAERPGILNMIVDAFKNLEARGKMVVPASAQAETERAQSNSDPLKAWYDEYCAPDEHGVWPPVARLPSSDFYRHYRQFCIDRGQQPKSEPHFGAGLTTISPGSATGKVRDERGKPVAGRTLPHRVLGVPSDAEEAVNEMLSVRAREDFRKRVFNPSLEAGALAEELMRRDENPIVEEGTAITFAYSIRSNIMVACDLASEGKYSEAIDLNICAYNLRLKETEIEVNGRMVNFTKYLESRIQSSAVTAGASRTSKEAAQLDQ